MSFSISFFCCCEFISLKKKQDFYLYIYSQSIGKCDRQLQSALLQNVVLAGGTSVINGDMLLCFLFCEQLDVFILGFSQRLEREMNLLYGEQKCVIHPVTWMALKICII